MDEPLPSGMTRRRMLAYGGGLLGGAVALAACGSTGTKESTTTTTASTTRGPDGSTTTTTSVPGGTSETQDLATGTPSTTVFTAKDFAGLGTCVLLPDLTQGPFPTRTEIERRDVTEDREGYPLRVGIQVVDETCEPIAGADVEIWHCDVDGDYSAYDDGYTDDDAGPGTTFLRGSQATNDDGIVEFVTIWPGWYGGRAIHIHSKVHLDDSTVLTTQYLFEDSLNAEVMQTEHYASHGEPDTPNARDGVTSGNEDLLLAVSDDADISGKRALIVVGLDPSATSSSEGQGPGGGGGPGGGRPGGGDGPGGAPPDGLGPPATEAPSV